MEGDVMGIFQRSGLKIYEGVIESLGLIERNNIRPVPGQLFLAQFLPFDAGEHFQDVAPGQGVIAVDNNLVHHSDREQGVLEPHAVTVGKPVHADVPEQALEIEITDAVPDGLAGKTVSGFYLDQRRTCSG